jgi:N-acetylgalactosamine kinase
MKISHDGDRVSIINSNGNYSRYDDPCSDSYLNALKSDLISEYPAKVSAAQLEMQPGYYACSTPKIDKMVDLACSVPGVVGAQLAGAGLGGCIMILAKKTAVDAVCKKLITEYYGPEKLKPALLPCTTVQGASTAQF